MCRKFKVLFWLLIFSILRCTPYYQHPGTDVPEGDLSEKISLRVLTQDRGYPLGGPVDLKIEIKNISKDLVRLSFNTNQLFDFVIYKNETEVWRWSYAKDFEKSELEISIYPEEVWSFRTEWDTKDKQKRFVLGGRYYIEGILKISPPLKSEKVEIGLTD